MAEIVITASLCGGCGKTSVAADIGYILALRGKRVLLADGGFYSSSLDMALGCGSASIYNIGDVISGKCDPNDAFDSLENNENLFFMPSAMEFLENFVFSEKIKGLYKDFDYIIIDTPSEPEKLKMLSRGGDTALIVCNQNSASARSASMTYDLLEECGIKNIKLVINKYDKKSAENGSMPCAYDIVNKAGVSLIGIIPYDENKMKDTENGICAFASERKNASPYEAAAFNIASRLMGEEIPLFRYTEKPKNKKFYINSQIGKEDN